LSSISEDNAICSCIVNLPVELDIDEKIPDGKGTKPLESKGTSFRRDRGKKNSNFASSVYSMGFISCLISMQFPIIWN
jgi:hypothetical protein